MKVFKAIDMINELNNIVREHGEDVTLHRDDAVYRDKEMTKRVPSLIELVDDICRDVYFDK